MSVRPRRSIFDDASTAADDAALPTMCGAVSTTVSPRVGVVGASKTGAVAEVPIAYLQARADRCACRGRFRCVARDVGTGETSTGRVCWWPPTSLGEAAELDHPCGRGAAGVRQSKRPQCDHVRAKGFPSSSAPVPPCWFRFPTAHRRCRRKPRRVRHRPARDVRQEFQSWPPRWNSDSARTSPSRRAGNHP